MPITDGQRDALKEEGAILRILLAAAIAVLISLVAFFFGPSTTPWIIRILAAVGAAGAAWFAWSVLKAGYDIANELRHEE